MYRLIQSLKCVCMFYPCQSHTDDHDEMENQDVQRQTESEEVILSSVERFSDSGTILTL